MRSFVKRTALLLAVTMLLGTLTACNGHTFAKGDTKLVSAKELSGYIGKDKVVVVDMQAPEEYAKGHVEGAVNIPSGEIVINVPVKNMLAGKKKIEKVMSANGIGNDTTVVVYDTDKMSAARLLWSLFMYGHENVLVVDGGLDAIKAAGLVMSTAVPSPAPATFTAGEPSGSWLVKMPEVQEQVNTPDKNVVLLDVRTDEEYMTEGKIPTAVMMDYITNYYGDNTLKDVQTTKINYLQAGIYPESEIIIYCKTSFRAAPVFLQLYEAGYRNIRIYDGAWLEWTANSGNPIDRPSGAAAPTNKDAS